MRFKWKQFAKDVRESRQDLGFGLREFGRKMGIHHATMCRVEQGKPIEAPTVIYLCEWMTQDPIFYLYKSDLKC